VTARANHIDELISPNQLHKAEVLATLHGYAVAFWWAAGFFGVGAVLTFGLLESGVPESDDGLANVT
jgi:hypothetical protein